jgi:hypothetical protein
MYNPKQQSEKVTSGEKTLPAGCLHILRQLICEKVPPGGCLQALRQLVCEKVPRAAVPEKPPLVPPPAPQRWKVALGVATTPFADRAHTEVMLASLSNLLAKRKASVRFSNYTGLVRSLQGELYPEQTATSAENMLDISEEFLREPGHQKALLGAEGYQWRPDSQPIIGSCARFRQTDQSGIPLYGGSMIFGFNENGQLSMVNSSWYPIPPEADYEQSFKLTWEEAHEIASRHVLTYFLAEAQSQSKSATDTPSLAKTPPPTKEDRELEVIPGDELKEGRVIFPQLDEDKVVEEDPYRPAWVVLVIDRGRSRSWQVIVDAEDGRVLAAADATVGATIHAHVYLDNTKALSEETTWRQLDGDIPSGKLADAPYFEMGGTDFAEPTPLSDNGFRSANVYYHLHHAREVFLEIAQNAWSAAPAVPTIPGEKKDDKVPVHMDATEASGYVHGTRSIHFGHGVKDESPPVEDESPLPVEDPACDCEAVYHEYAHAVLHVVQPDIFRQLPHARFNNAINEGLAFYFGCTLSERPASPARPYRWGEFAYRDPAWEGFCVLLREDPQEQKPEYDYLPVYGVFPGYAGGCEVRVKDDKECYACGMLWARALWDVRRVLGYDIADAIILRGLSLAGGAQSELETPTEAIIHTDGEYTKGGPPHESALRLLFCSRGIMADAPIHDLIEVELGEEGEDKTYVLAATENTARNNPQPGCMFSDDKGDHWDTLGTIDPPEDGPAEVVALAAAKVSETKAIIWAASEQWVKEDGEATLTSKVYWYQLELDSANRTINTDHSWSELESLPNNKKVNVLSLAAMKKPNGTDDECWLFVGTESGLYKYDNSWHYGPPSLSLRPIYGLAIREQPSQRLLVATKIGPFVLDPTNMDRDSKYEEKRPTDWTLTMVADPGGEDHLWAGTAFNGIYHFNPNNGEWEQDSTIDSRPVHCLLVEQGVSYAGTNDGVYRRLEGEGWEPFNDTSHQNTEAIEATSVVALSRAKDRLLAGTAQRGLWGRESANGWGRLTEGLPRIGRLTDATADTCNWSHKFQDHLPKGSVGTHVFYVPNDDCGSLSLEKEGDVKEPALYYVAPYINLGEDYGAGLQIRTLDNSGKMVETVQQGFYLLAVKAESETSYEIDVTLT